MAPPKKYLNYANRVSRANALRKRIKTIESRRDAAIDKANDQIAAIQAEIEDLENHGGFARMDLFDA